MKNRYLYISSGGPNVFPCSAGELRMTIDWRRPKILSAWPSNSHGPAFPMSRYEGVIVLDLQGEDPTKPLTEEEIKSIATRKEVTTGAS